MCSVPIETVDGKKPAGEKKIGLGGATGGGAGSGNGSAGSSNNNDAFNKHYNKELKVSEGKLWHLISQSCMYIDEIPIVLMELIESGIQYI